MKKIYTCIIVLTLMAFSFSANAFKVAINIEGTIVEVAEDNKSFKLDNGKWVIITKDTEFGISNPTIPQKEEKYFNPIFKVGNFINGFTMDDTKDRVIAYAIYTNLDLDDTIKDLK